LSNDIIIEAWNTVLFDKFVRFKHLLIDGLSSHSDEALSRHQHAQGLKVLDVGCGFGDSTFKIADTVGSEGEVWGVDCAENFIEACSKEAAGDGVSNVRFFVADVERDDLGGPYDEAFARFGTMFFNLAGLAMKNIRKSLKPGGKFTQIVWRRREDNPWVHEAEMCVKGIVPIVSHEDTDAVHCGPGPFSMSGPDMVSDMLRATGYERISFERFDSDICIGRDLDEAIEFAMSLGPAGEIIRLAADEGERLKPEVSTELRKVLEKYVVDDGRVMTPSSTWFVTAYNPE
jgi:ubiquinone/menaquinone biosynthesis C-methylase UbiE